MSEQPTEHWLQVAQSGETPVKKGENESFRWRYAYARSADTRSIDDKGEDYLTFRYDDHTFVFALCDGVSQSFYGGLAAQLIGNTLIEWLWDKLPPGADTMKIQTELTNHLQTLIPTATDMVHQHPIPRHLAPMLVEVLEEKRAMGSESMFIAGRIDAPGPAFPAGRVTLAWMGDSRLRLWGPDGELKDRLGDHFHTAQRWSSLNGPVGGEIHVFTGPVQPDLTGLMVYSDGMPWLDFFKGLPSSAVVQKLITRAGEQPASDDISFLEVRLGHAPEPNIVAIPPEVRPFLDTSPAPAAPGIDGRVAPTAAASELVTSQFGAATVPVVSTSPAAANQSFVAPITPTTATVPMAIPTATHAAQPARSRRSLALVAGIPALLIVGAAAFVLSQNGGTQGETQPTGTVAIVASPAATEPGTLPVPTGPTSTPLPGALNSPTPVTPTDTPTDTPTPTETWTPRPIPPSATRRPEVTVVVPTKPAQVTATSIPIIPTVVPTNTQPVIQPTKPKKTTEPTVPPKK